MVSGPDNTVGSKTRARQTGQDLPVTPRSALKYHESKERLVRQVREAAAVEAPSPRADVRGAAVEAWALLRS